MIRPIEIVNEYGEKTYAYLDDERMLVFTRWYTAELLNTLGFTWQYLSQEKGDEK